jgi:hypothetical protein
MKPGLEASSCEPQLFEDILHQAPFGEGGLKKIKTYKCCEQMPVGALKIA